MLLCLHSVWVKIIRSPLILMIMWNLILKKVNTGRNTANDNTSINSVSIYLTSPVTHYVVETVKCNLAFPLVSPPPMIDWQGALLLLLTITVRPSLSRPFEGYSNWKGVIFRVGGGGSAASFFNHREAAMDWSLSFQSETEWIQFRNQNKRVA